MLKHSGVIALESQQHLYLLSQPFVLQLPDHSLQDLRLLVFDQIQLQFLDYFPLLLVFKQLQVDFLLQILHLELSCIPKLVHSLHGAELGLVFLLDIVLHSILHLVAELNLKIEGRCLFLLTQVNRLDFLVLFLDFGHGLFHELKALLEVSSHSEDEEVHHLLELHSGLVVDFEHRKVAPVAELSQRPSVRVLEVSENFAELVHFLFESHEEFFPARHEILLGVEVSVEDFHEVSEEKVFLLFVVQNLDQHLFFCLVQSLTPHQIAFHLIDFENGGAEGEDLEELFQGVLLHEALVGFVVFTLLSLDQFDLCDAHQLFRFSHQFVYLLIHSLEEGLHFHLSFLVQHHFCLWLLALVCLCYLHLDHWFLIVFGQQIV